MKRTRLISAVLLSSGLILGTGLVGCGKKDSGPTPLSKRLDDSFIAGVAVEQKQQVIDTQSAWTTAKMERDGVSAKYAKAKTSAEIAKNDRDAAKIDQRSAERLKKDADASADTTRINDTEREVRKTMAQTKAAEARFSYLAAYRDALKVGLRAEEETVYWREAQYELAKARVAAANNIAPKGFLVGNFETQEAARAKRSASAKDNADKAMKKATGKREEWLKAQATADELTGTPKSHEDPLAPPPPADMMAPAAP